MTGPMSFGVKGLHAGDVDHKITAGTLIIYRQIY